MDITETLKNIRFDVSRMFKVIYYRALVRGTSKFPTVTNTHMYCSISTSKCTSDVYGHDVFYIRTAGYRMLLLDNTDSI